MKIHVQYLHLPSPAAELVWDCALPNANNLQMRLKSQTGKLKTAMALNSKIIPQWVDTLKKKKMREKNMARFFLR